MKRHAAGKRSQRASDVREREIGTTCVMEGSRGARDEVAAQHRDAVGSDPGGSPESLTTERNPLRWKEIPFYRWKSLLYRRKSSY